MTERSLLVLVLATSLGCATTAPSRAPVRAPEARGGGPPVIETQFEELTVDDVAQPLGAARCAREQRCGLERGPWPYSSACESRDDSLRTSLASACTTGIDPAPYQTCLDTLSEAPCGDTGALMICELAALCAP